MSKAGSQNASILKHLQSGNRLTPAQALSMFGCFRLAARVYDLRQEGARINSRRHPSGFAVYWI
jgi:hypothetical protein